MIAESNRSSNAEMKYEMENQFLDSEVCIELRTELESIGKKMLQFVQSHGAILNLIEESQQSSCTNLLFYLVLRSEDIRDLQNRLHILGLSSLASSESHIYSQMNAILERLGGIIPEKEKTFYSYENAVNDIQWKVRHFSETKKKQRFHILWSPWIQIFPTKQTI